VILDKGTPTRYPVPYTLWRKKRGLPRGQGLTYDHSLEEVVEITRRHSLAAEPVQPDDPTSSWLTAPRAALDGLRKVRGASDYVAHAGVCSGGLNAVYFVEKLMERPDGLVVISNITEGARVQVQQVREAVEPDLLYPLLRGRDVRRWNAEPSSHIVVVSREDGTVLSEEEMQSEYPRTYGYLARFRERLSGRTHPITRGALQRRAPFFWFMGLADYTFAPWKVVWPWISQTIAGAVCDRWEGKTVVPEHNVSLIPFDSEHEAHYTAAALNSSPFAGGAVGSWSGGGGGIASPVVMERLHVPAFDGSDLHVRLAELSQAAHQAAAAGDEERVAEIEAEIDELAAELWGLTEKELQAIREALEIVS
ncbi:MAG TPA: SAM-dependent DNA methyltransferase, partial [Armatimonadota bacterium]|nr:SAM-dependent DNA methyltransferase [Armatimonadota bacterium]